MDFKVKRIVFIAVLMLICLPLESRSADDKKCLDCHEKKIFIKLHQSAHKNIRCKRCHTDASLTHPEKLKQVRCRKCHQSEAGEFTKSDHGKALAIYTKKTGQKLCRKCHEDNPHNIRGQGDKESRIFRANIAETCARCHERPEIIKQYPYKPHPLKAYQKTIHGKSYAEGNTEAATCSDCHGSHANQFRLNPGSTLAVQNIAKTCGKCHESEYEEFVKSSHYKDAVKGIREAPICITCHGEHNIYAVTAEGARAYKSSISDNCGNCHGSERIARKFGLPKDRQTSYKVSFHGAMNNYGNLEVARCASCHGAHAVLPSSNPESKVHPKNLAKTCGVCHTEAGERLVQGKVHVNPKLAEEGPVYWVRMFYMFLIFGSIGFMLFHNVIDFRKKVSLQYKKAIREGKYIRLNKFERIQHYLLAGSFIGLAWTGFAIGYPDSVFAYPFKLWAGGQEIRYWIHRILAGVMIISSFLHIYYAFFTDKGKKEVPGFLPKLKDLKDLLGLMSYNLGLRKNRPVFDTVNYIEKAEYLALVWGTIVMAVTGCILLLYRYSLAYLPLVAINIATTIHLYEAILASLAILVWHFYTVIFDPDEYPMNWTWITGKLTPHQYEVRTGHKDESKKV